MAARSLSTSMGDIGVRIASRLSPPSSCDVLPTGSISFWHCSTFARHIGGHRQQWPKAKWLPSSRDVLLTLSITYGTAVESLVISMGHADGSGGLMRDSTVVV